MTIMVKSCHDVDQVLKLCHPRSGIVIVSVRYVMTDLVKGCVQLVTNNFQLC